MHRIIEYPVTAADSGRKISEFLRQRGYSAQTLIRLKKDPRGILKNGVSSFQNVRLEEGDSLTVCICEETSSEHIPPVDLPLDILYEDEDLCVINKPAGMPIHPSLHNYENSLANGPYRESPLSSAASTGWTGIPPGSPLSPSTMSVPEFCPRW